MGRSLIFVILIGVLIFPAIAQAQQLTISAGPCNPPNTNEAPGASNVEMLQLRLSASSAGNVTVSSIVFNATGTGHDGSVTNYGYGDLVPHTAFPVRLFRDVNSNGLLDAGDIQLAPYGYYNANNGVVSFTTNRIISAGTSED